jgi:hypothetical protein
MVKTTQRNISGEEVAYVLGRVSYHIPELKDFILKQYDNNCDFVRDFSRLFAEKWNESDKIQTRKLWSDIN